MARTSEHGLPIGDEVPGWTARARPERPRLAGSYVTLEPVAAHHAEALFAATRDPALWTYRHDEPPADVAELAARIEEWAASDDNVTFALVPHETGTCAGVATLCRIDPANGSAEVGAVLYGDGLARGRAATEAIALLARHLFDRLGYRRFEWKLDALNTPSALAARRLGFSYEGRFRNALVYKGRNRDTDWFAMTDADWRRLAPAYDAWLEPGNFDEQGHQRSRLSDLTARALTGGGMAQRISFVTLAVADLEATRRFYVDGLGWQPEMFVPGEVLMIKVGERLLLSLWAESGFEAEVGPIRRGEGLAPLTLAHNLATRAEVDEVLAIARRAGADPVAEAEERDWGGYTGYFADPDGFRWEIAWNPGPIGQVVLP